MGKYFGTDGFRGEANIQLTVDHAFKVGRYVGWYYGRDHKAKIVIGKDTRRSSYMFEYALVAGLTASGADAYLLHVTTTPSVSYAVRTEDFDCGIMISASHNPFYDNGIKLLNGNGQKIEAEVEARIEAYLDGKIEELPYATREDIGRTVDFASFCAEGEYRSHRRFLRGQKPLYRIPDLHSVPRFQKYQSWSGLLQRKFFCDRKECF